MRFRQKAQMADVRVPCRETGLISARERVGVACEDSSYEKVISPMSDITSRAKLAEGSCTVSLQDFETAPAHRQ